MTTEERETVSLIGSDKVEGTSVFGDETQIGSIERVMIDKRSGKVSYAVLSFGGFLGIGDDHYPLPWQSLKYDTNLGGYRTGVTEKPCKARRNTAATTIGVGKIEPVLGASTITTVSSLPEPVTVRATTSSNDFDDATVSMKRRSPSNDHRLISAFLANFS
ncbi:PRC-barrel domain-containing protein [Leptospira interrogans]